MFVIKFTDRPQLPLYLGRRGETNCRVLEEARVYATRAGAARWLDGRGCRAEILPVITGERLRGRGPYARELA